MSEADRLPRIEKFSSRADSHSDYCLIQSAKSATKQTMISKTYTLINFIYRLILLPSHESVTVMRFLLQDYFL